MAILPIITYNDPVLRKKTEPVTENGPKLQTLIDDMFETMYNASGVGLAAPQIGKLLRIFVVDADAITEQSEEPDLGPMVFINPQITKRFGDKLKMEEGCLSIPQVRDDVKRLSDINIQYLDRSFKPKKMSFDGWISRIVQHEYDHLEGKLFLDYLSSFRRRMHRSKLQQIEDGLLKTDYLLKLKTVGKEA